MMRIKSRSSRGKVPRRSAFTLIELLVTVAIIGLLATMAVMTVPSMIQRANQADALAKIRLMGTAVLQYVHDHAGLLPPLFPGQVLEYEEGRAGRIVTECANYLAIETYPEKYLVASLMPRAYARVREPSDHTQMRVYVMNSRVTNNGAVVTPFGGISGGQVDGKSSSLAAVAGLGDLWMMSTADQLHPNVATAPWKGNTPAKPPLDGNRAVFRFDGSAGLVNINTP
jgi:prepilin-type N-terminal cleavage/methylation domain-containing protein